MFILLLVQCHLRWLVLLVWFYFSLTCEQVPKWGVGRKENLASQAGERGMGASSIFVFTLYPTWEPVHKLISLMPYNAKLAL